VRLDEVAGSVTTDAEAAQAFLRAWYEPDDLVTLVGVREKKPNQPHLLANVVTARDLLHQLREPGWLDEQVLSDDGERWNVYVQVNPALGPLESALKRGGDSNVRCVRGVWVDLDVKPGSFTGVEDALNLLRGLEVFPNIVVETGSGGVHGYWRLNLDVSLDRGRELARAWWSHLSERAEAQGAEVDRLIDMARMMRLPGTIRWPKRGEVMAPHQVTLRYAGGEHVSAERLREVSRGANERRTTRIAHTRRTDQSRRASVEELARELLSGEDGSWPMLLAMSRIEEIFAEHVTWDDVLEPAGWTYLRTDHNERREWARPGRDEKSATTDWPDSPHVMSLLSGSEDTGLLDLKEAEVPLTLWRVGLRLMFNDDEAAMVRWVLGHVQTTRETV
jgi:hypothetical protein